MKDRSAALKFSPQIQDRGRPRSDTGEIDTRALRDNLGSYASGIAVIASHDGKEPFGFTCQSFHSVSLNPPLISFGVMKTSSSYPRIQETRTFSVNVLAKTQQGISAQLARRGGDKWAGIAWDMTPGSNPAIAGTLMWLDCDLFAEHEAGDHYIVIGRVSGMSPRGWHDGEPLLYFKGQYRHLRERDASNAEPTPCAG